MIQERKCEVGIRIGNSITKITPSEIRARNHIHRRIISNITVSSMTLLPTCRSSMQLSSYPCPLLTPQSCSGKKESPLKRMSLDQRPVLAPATEIKKNLIKHFGMSPQMALTKFSELLTPYEKKEITRYKNIYFMRKKYSGHIGAYTSTEGDYVWEFGDHISYRYEILSRIDSGSFGQVLRCMDHKTLQEVAIKILKKSHQSKRQGLNECKIAFLLNEDNQENHCIGKIKRKFEFRFHFFIVFELLSINLFDFMAKNNFKPLSVSITKRITVQLLRGLSHMHNLQIIHCDLKPENIVFKHSNKSSIRIIDFGTSCFFNARVYTYIQSRIYRSPEIVLQISYNEAIDIWSLGCIVFEMLTGNPPFTGNSERELMTSMINVLGMPPEDLIKKAKAKFVIDNAEIKPASRPLSRLLSDKSPYIIEFIEKCLKWRAEERITAKEGLRSNWIQCIHSKQSSLLNTSL
ncbi:hypothetical protein SteCoe_6288 [Stentor coeruleus]|uniref:dual-specificity kinase n=1 Tax=Stentor coeruleus TaxID=5963 RepID=A0A1R2CQD1_9CILI|nr:hypothetical protein SteCoe_6288 [Stentor coeruleus]